ncbi:MAG: biotin--[acetyl-CoA-carboxylase] ligase [Propioniciclava sp.]
MPSPFLDATEIQRSSLAAGWHRAEVLTTTGSTNADLVARAEEGAEAGAVLVAAHQSRGRGRMDRDWEAPPDTSLACSVLVAPEREPADWGWLPLVVGLAVVDGLATSAGLQAGLKWPNDVLVGDRKICGILCKAVSSPSGPMGVLGFGINVSMSAEQLPVATATSVRLAGSDATATAVVTGVLERLAERYRAWDAGQDVARDYRERCLSLGQEVEVQLSEESFVGTAVDIDAHGGLVVEAGGERRTVVAGDVLHLRGA